MRKEKEMKESGMKKLINLAIKYDREKEGTSFDWSITNGDFENHIYQKYLISKEYGFIKWLVENDKIDRVKIPKIDGSYYAIYDEDDVIMNLSISDTPIDDLILYLK